MLISRHYLLPLFPGLLLAATSLVRAADAPAPPVPAPAFVDVVSFEYDDNGELHKAVVTFGPNLLRVDEADQGYSILYNPLTDFYTGLEHRNYTYWQFSWPEVRAAVETSKRHEARLQELGNEGLNSDSLDASLNTNNAASASAGSDDSGYVWHPSAERKRIADLDCVRWIGDTVSGETVEAWCYAGPLPKVQGAIDQLRKINEPIALVPVRTVVPDFIFPVYSALTKGGVTPLLINWGDGQEKHHFRFLEARTSPGKLSLFAIPKLYTKTTLITMDGMIEEQPAPAPRTSAPAKTWQN